ncbi:MAG: hypothetical protein EAX89_05005 [Candidatus Lokiarchaeota archaeon]|nr:hypothetical protein [Candidatus Lokiarchaeota archaeon]
MVRSKISKIKDKVKSISFNLSSIVIPILQYVPCASIWHGIMSIPLISYIVYFFQNPAILQNDLNFFYRFHGTYIAYFGLALYVFCLIYQITHRRRLIQTGPYKIIRHPQYLAFIILTFGLTLVSFQTYPITIFDPFEVNGYTIIFYIWILEVLAYVTLAKIEDISLKAKYGEIFVDYAMRVPSLFPFFRLNKNVDNKNKEALEKNI